MVTPGIAVVGDFNSPVMTKMRDYLYTLNEWQRVNFPDINAKIEEQTKIDPEYTAFEIQFLEFDTKDDLFSYVSEENYLASIDYSIPICYGFGVNEDADGNWSIELFMNDQTTMGPMYANIPNQYGTSWSGTLTTPNTNSYQMFWQRGYAVIENLAVNMIIAEGTDTDTANLALMAIPMQSNTAVVDSFA